MINVEDFKDRMDEYYYAFGKFMNSIAATEAGLNATVLNFVSSRLRHDLKDSYAILKAVLGGGQQLAAVSDTLKRLLAATTSSEARQKELAYVLNHLAKIGILRNRIAHNSASADMSRGGAWYDSYNNKMASYQFTIQTLDAATRDVGVISERVHRAMEPDIYINSDKTPDGAERRKALFDPWHYNHAIVLGETIDIEAPPVTRRQRKPKK